MIGARPLTPDEIKLLELCLQPREWVFFRVCLSTGFRPSETLSLRVCDFEGNRVTVQKRNTKGKLRSRSAYLEPALRQLVQDYVNAQGLGPQDYVFRSRESKGGPVSYYQVLNCFKVGAAKAGLKGRVTLHSPRKTFAEHVYRTTGKDVVKTARMLGHSDVNNTMAYISFATEEADRIVEAMPWARV